MKRVICIILSAILVTGLFCACGKNENETESDKKLKVVATIFPPYDFAKQIGGDNIEVSMLLKPGMESHSYDPTPQDIIKIQESDLFIYTGGESDEWVRDILESDELKPKKVIELMDCVDTVEEEIISGMTVDEEDGEEKEYDEHVWTSPKNAVIITRKISETLKELDKSHTADFDKNTMDYCSQLSALDNTFKEIVENAKRKTIVFGDRFPFKYFTDEYDLKYYAAFPGCSSETEPSASTISFLIDKVKENNIPVIFTIEFSSGKVADTICESTGAKKKQFHSCHNITQQEFDSGVSYLELMQNNVKVLKEALE